MKILRYLRSISKWKYLKKNFSIETEINTYNSNSDLSQLIFEF